MTLLEAHEKFAREYAEDRAALWAMLPEGVEPRVLHGIDTTPTALTAAASLSGQLDDARNWSDLNAACEHFASLWAMELVTPEQLNAEALEVIGELLKWGATAHELN
jgi:hypothetical protein